jgi:hypothetical protein
MLIITVIVVVHTLEKEDIGIQPNGKNMVKVTFQQVYGKVKDVVHGLGVRVVEETVLLIDQERGDTHVQELQRFRVTQLISGFRIKPGTARDLIHRLRFGVDFQIHRVR